MTTENEKNVHTEHCCIFHGCKYNKEDCPVMTRKQAQSYPCEDCEPGPVGDPQSVAIREAAEELRKLTQEAAFMSTVAQVALANGGPLAKQQNREATKRYYAIEKAKMALYQTFIRDWLTPAQAL